MQSLLKFQLKQMEIDDFMQPWPLTFWAKKKSPIGFYLLLGEPIQWLIIMIINVLLGHSNAGVPSVEVQPPMYDLIKIQAFFLLGTLSS